MEVDLRSAFPPGQYDEDLTARLVPVAVDEHKETARTQLYRRLTAKVSLRTDAGAARSFAEIIGDSIRYDHARKRWLVWNEHRWQADENGNVNRLALELADLIQQAAYDKALGLGEADQKRWFAWGLDLHKRARHEALLAIARNLEPIADSGKDWDVAPGLLGVPNGVIELRSGELRDGRSEDRITKQTGVEFDPAAECPRWESFLREVFVDDETVAYVQRLAGATISAEGSLQLVAFLKGVGSNGKSLFLKLLTDVLGDYAYDLPAGTMLAGSRNAHMHWIAGMEGARLVTCMELGDSEELNTDRLKHISGGDAVSADEKFKAGRKFPQTWIVWMTTNKQPRPTENTVAFWRRVRVVPTPNHFDPDDEPDLEDKLRAELPGILRWLVEGAVAYYAGNRREGDRPKSVIEGTDEWREEVDKLAPVLDAGYLTRVDANVWTPTATLFEGYKQYAAARGIPDAFRMQEATFGRRLAEQFVPSRRMVETSEGRKQLRGYHGVKAGSVAGWNLYLGSWRVNEIGVTAPWEA